MILHSQVTQACSKSHWQRVYCAHWQWLSLPVPEGCQPEYGHVVVIRLTAARLARSPGHGLRRGAELTVTASASPVRLGLGVSRSGFVNHHELGLIIVVPVPVIGP
jgi:hypothetical protein